MSTTLIRKATVSLCLALFCLFASAQPVNEPKGLNPDYSKPYAPFRIAGNLYYVGTYDLASYLIVTSKGNILINTGLAASASLIQKNIEALGFRFADTRILLTNQAHYDHLGAMAAIKKTTGAKLYIDAQDSAVVADGGSSDYAFGGKGSLFQGVRPDRLLRDKDTINLGETKLTLLHHPGHTRGSCSFLFTVKDEHRAYTVLIANLPTIVVEQKFSAIPDYPGIAKDYAYTLSAMKKLTFDIWLAAHASQFDLHKKHQPGDRYNPAAFTDRKGYDDALELLQRDYQKKVTRNKE